MSEETKNTQVPEEEAISEKELNEQMPLAKKNML